MSSPANPPNVLVSKLTDEDMRELVEEFVGELPARVRIIEAGLREQDLEAIRRAAHQSKGSAGGYGFPTITDAANDLEQSVKTGETMETLAQQCRVLTELCRQARARAPKV